MQAVVLGLVAAASFGAVFVALRWAYAKTGVGSTQAAVISVSTAALVVTTIAVATGAFAGITVSTALPYVVSGLFAPGLSHLAMYRSIDTFGGTRTAVVLGFVPVLAVLAAWILLDEAPGWLVAVGGVFVVAAGILIVDPRAAFSSGRVGASPLLAFVAVLCFASRDVVVRGVDVVLAAVAGSALSLITAAVLLVAVNATSARTEIAAAVRNHLGPLLVPGLFMAVGFTSLIAGFAQGRVAVVSTMAATQSVWAVIMARLFLDRSEWDRRVVIASLLATAGGIVVAVGA